MAAVTDKKEILWLNNQGSIMMDMGFIRYYQKKQFFVDMGFFLDNTWSSEKKKNSMWTSSLFLGQSFTGQEYSNIYEEYSLQGDNLVCILEDFDLEETKGVSGEKKIIKLRKYVEGLSEDDRLVFFGRFITVFNMCKEKWWSLYKPEGLRDDVFTSRVAEFLTIMCNVQHANVHPVYLSCVVSPELVKLPRCNQCKCYIESIGKAFLLHSLYTDIMVREDNVVIDEEQWELQQEGYARYDSMTYEFCTEECRKAYKEQLEHEKKTRKLSWFSYSNLSPKGIPIDLLKNKTYNFRIKTCNAIRLLESTFILENYKAIMELMPAMDGEPHKVLAKRYLREASVIPDLIDMIFKYLPF